MSDKVPEPTPYTLRAIISHKGEQVSIRWVVEGDVKGGLDPEFFEPDYFNAYEVGKTSLYACGNKIREILGELQDRLEGIKSEVGDDAKHIIRRLAYEGTEFYDIIFRGHSAAKGSQKMAQFFHEWFVEHVENAPHGTWRIQVEHLDYSAGVLPWGLIFTPPGDKSIDELAGEPGDFDGFWCMSYFLACRGATQQEYARSISGTQKFKLAAIVEIDEQKVTEFFELGIVEDLDREEFSEAVVDRVHELKDLSERNPNTNKFWYISLRASGGKYQLSGDEILGENYMSKEEFGIEDGGVGMALLDGDAVIRGDRGSLWVNRILHAPATGMIAVETDVDNPKLKFAGWEILKTIIGRKDQFLMAVYQARKEYWPLGLLYGVYSNPLHIYADPPHEATKRISGYLGFIKDRIDENG